jgi:inner membrane protein
VYRHGHTGVGLLLYAPVGYAALTTGWPVLAAAGFAVMIWLVMLPDIDMRISVLSHRGPTHTLAFAAMVGLACGAGGWIVGAKLTGFTPRLLAGFGALVGVLVVFSHLLADWLTPMGVAPFWPLSGKRYSLSLVYASNVPANYLLLLFGVGATVATLWFAGVIG